MEYYNFSFSADVFEKHIIVRHRESGEIYCFPKSNYDQIKAERNISHISKCPNELINVYLINKSKGEATNTYKSFSVNELQGGISSGSNMFYFNDTW